MRTHEFQQQRFQRQPSTANPTLNTIHFCGRVFNNYYCTLCRCFSCRTRTTYVIREFVTISKKGRENNII